MVMKRHLERKSKQGVNIQYEKWSQVIQELTIITCLKVVSNKIEFALYKCGSQPRFV